LGTSEGVFTQELARLREKGKAAVSSISNSQDSVSDRLLAVTCSTAGFVRQGISGQQAIENLKAEISPELIRQDREAKRYPIRRLPTRQEERNPTGLLLSGERRIASSAYNTILTLTRNSTTDNSTRQTRPQDYKTRVSIPNPSGGELTIGGTLVEV